MRSPLRSILIGAALVLLVYATYREVLGLGMLGWDGWPLVAASRLHSLGDLPRLFGEELMNGRYPYGHFYRPITELTFGLDALWSGLDPRGYHLTDLLLFSGTALCLASLTRRLACPGTGSAAALVAGVLFVLHPVQLELLVVPARRADLLAMLCGLGCLLCQDPGGGRGRRIAGALLAAMAIGSKETGAWVLPAVLGYHLLFTGGGMGRALRGALPALVGGGLVLALRTWVLGGLGGHVGDLAPRVGTGELWAGLARGLFAPEPTSGGLTGWITAGALLVLLGASKGRARVLSFAGLVALSLLLLTSLADRLHSWYASLFTVPLALAAGTAWASGDEEEGRRLRRIIVRLGVVGLGLLFLLGSPLVRSYPYLDAASRWLDQAYAQLEREIADAEPGELVRINPWPVGVPPLPRGRDVQSLALARDYTVAAYLELHHPQRPFQVRLFDGRAPARPIPGVILVELIPSAPPSWVLEAARPARR